MPAGEPVLGSSSSNRQLARIDLENSNVSTGHARQRTPPTGGPGDRRSGTRSARASATTAAPSELGETYDPRHERHIT
jgi:hypothetical protein